MSLFSIITVTRNNGEGLARTYASLAAQSLADYEWIVIDGASSDSTLGFMKDKPALLVSEPDKGIYDAMNKGLERASGDFLIFMNAGDCFAGAQVLEELSHVLRAEQTVFAYGDAWEEQSGGRPFYKRARRHHHIAYGMFTHHQAMVYKRAALGDMRYDLRYKIASDYDLTCRFLMQDKEGKISYLPQALCLFEAGGISQQQTREGRCEQFMIRRNLKIVSLLLNSAIYAGQALSLSLRRLCPPLYRFCKTRIMR